MPWTDPNHPRFRVIRRDSPPPIRPQLLYVEGDSGARRTHARFFETRYPHVLAVGGVAEAMALVATGVGLWCGFVCGQHLPAPEGIRLLQRLRARYPDVPAALLTGLLTRDLPNLCSEAGVYYIVRPSPERAFDAFFSDVRRLADRVRWPSLAACLAHSGATHREADVLRLSLLGGATKTSIARALGISSHTVKTHVRNILAKTDCASMEELRGRILELPRACRR